MGQIHQDDLAYWMPSSAKAHSNWSKHLLVTPEAATGLRALAEALPPGATVPVPREWLLELLAVGVTAPASGVPMDPTVEVVASRYGRAASTVRGWCEAGRFPGAYKLHNREWRIPGAALEAFDTTQRERPASRRHSSAQSLGDWRRDPRSEA
jgi:hypothetical protein